MEYNFHSFYLIGAVILFIILFIFEFLFPLRNRIMKLLFRLFSNLFLSLLVFTVVFIAVQPAQTFALGFSESSKFGLLNIFQFNPTLDFIIGFLLMDLAFYYWHLLNHKIPILWRFHNVHHYDPDLDISTAFRFHFGEILFSSLFRIIQISLIGISPITFFIYEIFFTANTLFQHSNIKLPIKFERLLNKIIVTPRMHGIHHSNYKFETNSNFSTLFSFWDRIHNTILLNIPQNQIVIGVPAYTNLNENKISKLIVNPFIKQKEYWIDKSMTFDKRQDHDQKNKNFLEE